VRVAVLGAGAWGTALAKVIAENRHEIVLWAHEPQLLQTIQRVGRNESYLPGIQLPPEIRFEADLQKAIGDIDCAVLAVPSRAVREVSKGLANFKGVLVSVVKGIEFETGLTMSGILRETAPGATTVALSGPTFAIEAARGIPTACVAASKNSAAAQQVQQAFHRPQFRIYTSADLLGVEIGGALKNVVAIAAGTGDGLGFGDNSKAALITRGIVEMQRLGVAFGARVETFAGLSGLGDLTATCYSRLSRNRAFGERLGRGGKLQGLVASSSPVPEGYPTTRSAFQLARKLGVETPIIDETYAMLYEGKEPRKAVYDLTNRESKAESW
jgi:glycerol-3-phosphate dehydrogenase (NAD(P)+)